MKYSESAVNFVLCPYSITFLLLCNVCMLKITIRVIESFLMLCVVISVMFLLDSSEIQQSSSRSNLNDSFRSPSTNVSWTGTCRSVASGGVEVSTVYSSSICNLVCFCMRGCCSVWYTSWQTYLLRRYLNVWCKENFQFRSLIVRTM